MKTLGHHTCSREGSIADVKDNAPYLSTHFDADDERKFLGTGYYLWDYNVDYAKHWGNRHYKGKFFVIEFELTLEKPYFLDLAGNRQDLEWLIDQWEFQSSEDYELQDQGDDWNIGEFIQYLRELRDFTQDEKVFPYTAIRAVVYNDRNVEQDLYKFVRDNGSKINLNPRFFICMEEKKGILLPGEIIYDSTRQKQS